MKEVFSHSVIKPFSYFGLTASYWDLNIDILAETWVMMGMLVGFIFVIRMLLLSKENIFFKQGLLMATGFFIDMIEETCGSFKQDIFYFVTTIFLFITGSGLVGLIPYMGEPTIDLNTTFALGISSFLFVQYQGIKAHGIYHFNEFLQPFAFFLPLNIVGELAKAASMSFRLFGNILGGSIMVDLLLKALEQVRTQYLSLVGFVCLLSVFFYFIPSMRRFFSYKTYSLDVILLTVIVIVPTIKIFFGAIEGLIQAFVLTTLTVTYSSMAIGVENEDEATTDIISKEA